MAQVINTSDGKPVTPENPLPVTVVGGSGGNGNDGKSAYEVALENGFEGTEEQWLTSLIGPRGPQGERGEKGEVGAPGTNGVDGKDGVSPEPQSTPEQVTALLDLIAVEE